MRQDLDAAGIPAFPLTPATLAEVLLRDLLHATEQAAKWEACARTLAAENRALRAESQAEPTAPVRLRQEG